MTENKVPKDDDFDDVNELDIVDVEDADFSETDDAWDEFDDESPETDKATAAPLPGKTGKKTFAQKYFTYIVGAVIVIGGGLFFLGIAGKSPTVLPDAEMAATESENNGVTELADGSAPPMPAPIDSTTDISESTTPPAEQPPAEPEALTPLPGSQELAKVELNDLNAAPAPEAEAPPAESPPVEAPAPVNNLEQAPPASAAPVEPVIQDPSAQNIIAPVQEPAQPDPAQVEKIASLEQNLLAAKNDLQSKTQELDAANQQVASLNDSLKEMESKLADMTRKAQQAQTKAESSAAEAEEARAKAAQEAAKPKEEPKQVEAESEPAPLLEEKPTAAPKLTKPQAAEAPATKSQKWVLRAAQPGKASLAPKGSNEMRSVSMGDTVEGLGKIVSIQSENGVWTVRGTKGFVTR